MGVGTKVVASVACRLVCVETGLAAPACWAICTPTTVLINQSWQRHCF